MPGEVIEGEVKLDLSQVYKSYKLTVGLASRACVQFHNPTENKPENIAFRDEISNYCKITLADFWNDNFEPPLNTRYEEPYRFSF